MADRQNNTKNEAPDSEELKRYLFYETSEAERGQLEARFFDDDELFYELLDLENDLTDRYARNELGANDRARFESSLKKSPERRIKLANASTLQSFITEETRVAAPLKIAGTRAGFWEQVKSFFNFSAFSFQSAAVFLLILLLAGIGFLIYEKQRGAQELARLREIETQRNIEIEQKENALQEQIKTVQEREQNLQIELDKRRGQTEILTEQLEKEQSEKMRLTRELEVLKRQKSTFPPEVSPPAPTVATVILAPIGGKGGGDPTVISVNQNTMTIAATLQIPSDSVAESFSVRLNSVSLGDNLKPNHTKSGAKFIRIVFSTKKLSSESENLIGVTGDDGSRYNYVLQRKK